MNRGHPNRYIWLLIKANSQMYYLRHKQYELLTGFVISVCFIFLIISVFKVTESKSKSFYYTARFNQVDGISVGSEVKIAGIPVGIVKDLYLDKDLRAVISITVENNIILDSESVASITTPGLFGKKYIQLDIGSGNTLKPGQEIIYTEDSLILADLLKIIGSKSKRHDDVEYNKRMP
ncbi:MAG: organic solvent ABC transporter substrate-binding protein [Rhodospirillaceae bacterium]|nr:organic solvent ABC transporter substrate-binding protein [Rhodospirillaceae bacterium]